MDVKKAIWTGVLFGLNQSLSWWLTALVLWFATILLTSSSTTTISVVDTIQVINLLLFSMGTAMMMLQNIPQLGQAKANAVKILYYTTLSYRNSHEGRSETRTVTTFPIAMRNLQFAYPPSAKHDRSSISTEFLNMTLWIDQGDYVAIVGPSGGGKSTVANLLLRVHEPLAYPAASAPQGPPSYEESFGVDYRPLYGGRSNNLRTPLSYGYVPADELSTPALRTLMASVPQHPFLFPTTIRENVLYVLHPDSPYRSSEHGAVVAAAKLAGAHEFIVSLEDGYSTIVDEGGLGLSGGQMQRISIARALVRTPKLLVLDETTSALDVESAEGIRAAIRDMVMIGGQQEEDKMTVVVVTHSEQMMKIAGRIVVIDQGTVVEEGAYDDLLARRGRFAAILGAAARIDESSSPRGVGEEQLARTGTGSNASPPARPRLYRAPPPSQHQAEPYASQGDDGPEELWEEPLNDTRTFTTWDTTGAETHTHYGQHQHQQHVLSGPDEASRDALQRLLGPPRRIDIRRGHGEADRAGPS